MAYDVQAAAAQVQETDSVRVNLTQTGLFSDAEAIRSWTVNEDRQAAVIWFLDRFTSQKNYANDPTVPKLSVVAPQVGDETLEGTWRLLNNVVVPDLPGKVVQTLRRGFIESLDDGNGEVDWTEARFLATGQVNNGEAEWLFVGWANCSPDAVRSLVNFLTLADYSGWRPVIRGELQTDALGAGFVRQFVTFVIEQDGSATVQLMLSDAQINNDLYENWKTDQQEDVTNHYNVPPEVRQALLDAHKYITPGHPPVPAVYRVGATARESYDQTSNTYNLTLYSPTAGVSKEFDEELTTSDATHKVHTWYAWGLTEAEAESADYDLPETPDQSESWIRDRSRMGSGRYAIQMRRRTKRPGSKSVTVNLGKSGTELHVIKWGQLDKELSKLKNFATNSGMNMRRINGPVRDPVDGTWSWHEVWTKDDHIGQYPTSEYVFSVDLSKRTVWDTENHVFVGQTYYIKWKHAFKSFTTSTQAHAWARASDARMVQTVRQLGPKRFLGVKISVEHEEPWFDD